MDFEDGKSNLTIMQYLSHPINSVTCVIQIILLATYLIPFTYRSSIAASFPSEFWTHAAISVAIGFFTFSFAHQVFIRSRKHLFLDSITYLVLPLFFVLALFEPNLYSSSYIFRFLFVITFAWKAYVLIRGIFPKLRMNRGRSNWKRVAFLSTFLCLIPLSSLHVKTAPLGGDEPYFLLIAYSLINDFDVKLDNNYINQDSLEFMETALSPQQWDAFRNGHMLSRHSPFLPILLIPGFFLLGRLGALFTMNLLVAWLCVILLDVIYELSGKFKASILASFLTVLTCPVFMYTFKLYTEIPAALLALICYRSALRYLRSRPGNITWMIAINALMALWKARFLSLTLPIAMVGFILKRFKLRRITIIFLVCLLGLAIILGFNWIVFGSPLIRYSISHLTNTSPYRIIRGVLGLLWDAQYGIFPLNPLMLIGVIGIPFLTSKVEPKSVVLWMMFLPYFFVIASYAELIGGVCPRGRFNLAWSVFLAIPLCFYLIHARGVFYRSLLILCSSLALIVSLFSILSPQISIEMPGFSSNFLSTACFHLNVDILGILPSFDRPDASAFAFGLVASCVVALLSFLITKPRKHSFFRYQIPMISLVACLSGVAFIPILAEHIQTDWMECEDPVFENHLGNTFWEEPFHWNQETQFAQPYYVGITLAPGQQFSRSIALRGHGNTLELQARADCPQEYFPQLSLMIADTPCETHWMQSDSFVSYYFHLPDWFDSDNPNLIVRNTSGKQEGFIYIDKLRLVDHQDNMILPSQPTRFPVAFAESKIIECNLLDNQIRQGTHCHLSLEIQDSHNGTLSYYIDFSQRLNSFEHLLDRALDLTDRPLLLPESYGTGDFCLAIKAKQDGSLIPPQGFQHFETAGGAWIGWIRVIPSLIEPDHIACAKLKSIEPDVTIIPHRIILSGGDQIEVPINLKQCYSILIVSSITHVFECIPFREQIATISLNSPNAKISSIPIIIGDHTAEEMYELPIEQMRLTHDKPREFSRIKKRVEWPPALKGIEYDALTYICEIALPTVRDLDAISFKVDNPMGVFDVHAIGIRTLSR